MKRFDNNNDKMDVRIDSFWFVTLNSVLDWHLEGKHLFTFVVSRTLYYQKIFYQYYFVKYVNCLPVLYPSSSRPGNDPGVDSLSDRRIFSTPTSVTASIMPSFALPPLLCLLNTFLRMKQKHKKD